MWITVAGLPPDRASAASAQDKYNFAERCYQRLRQSPEKQQHREAWLQCIDHFEAVYRHSPTGAWAAAGLYQAGSLYRDLYRRLHSLNDRQEAEDHFKRIIKRFPQSRYVGKARTALAEMVRDDRKKAVAGGPARASSQKDPPRVAGMRALYNQAEVCRRDLQNNPEKQKYRSNWTTCIEQFAEIHRRDPTGPWAAAGLYRGGRLQQQLYRRSGNYSDKTAAVGKFEAIVTGFPNSLYRKKAIEALGDISSEQKKGPSAAGNSDFFSSGPPTVTNRNPCTVTGLRYWSNPNYTRIVVDADRKTEFKHHLLKENPEIGKPQRLYVDLKRSRLKKTAQRTVAINDNLLINARAGQLDADTVRVAIDIKSHKTYKVFYLKDPFRIVIDVWGETATATARSAGDAPAGQRGGKLGKGALARQLALGVRRIVVDPGHGGKDYGAPGYLKGVHEKAVVLKIAERLAAKIRTQLGCEVLMTRSGDRYLTLEERTAFANTHNADLFISIHTNSTRSRSTFGIETFYLNLATDDAAIRVAARENATSTKNISDLQSILNDLMQNAKIDESSRLAAHVQQALYRHMKQKYTRIKNNGVKQAPFYVLLGAQMPSILVETSFISNPRECRRLIDPLYQEHLCDAIVSGIKRYIGETHPAPFFDSARLQGAGG
jgi:N-acetylmuramoyl-L-alanine amidase